MVGTDRCAGKVPLGCKSQYPIQSGQSTRIGLVLLWQVATYAVTAPSRERIPFSSYGHQRYLCTLTPVIRLFTQTSDCFSFSSCHGRPQSGSKCLFKAVGLGKLSHSSLAWVYRNFHSLFDANFSAVDMLFERARLGLKSSRTRHPSQPPARAASQVALGVQSIFRCRSKAAQSRTPGPKP